jgi:ribose transport system substrate-binding protein
MVQRRSIFIGVAMATLLAITSGCTSTASESTDPTSAASSGTQVTGLAGDITTLCGPDPVKVGFLHGAASNLWSVTTAAEFAAEAAKCPNITEVLYSEGGTQEKAISDILSFVAQGVNVIVITTDFGAVELPAIKQATAAGVKVVSMFGSADGVVGTDVVDVVNLDVTYVTQQWADFLNETVKKGTVAFLGGTAGNETSTYFFGAFQEAMAQYPDITIVDSRFQETDWDPVVRRKVMSGLLSQHGRIDAIVSDSNAADIGALQAYDDASMARPVVASITPTNQLNCDWVESPYQYMTFGQTSSLTRLGLRLGMAAFNGIAYDEASLVEPKAFIFEPGGTAPNCQPDLPLDADLTADLTTEQLTKLFQK